MFSGAGDIGGTLLKFVRWPVLAILYCNGSGMFQALGVSERMASSNGFQVIVRVLFGRNIFAEVTCTPARLESLP